MAWIDALNEVLGFLFAPAPLGGAGVGVVTDYTSTEPAPGVDSNEGIAQARRQLTAVGVVVAALVSAPALYIAYKASSKGKKRKLRDKELMFGQSLENASTQATGLLMTALAAPALSTAGAYILVQKLEDARFITRGLGNATQGLLTVAAAGPAIQGIGQIAGSAFKKGK